MTSFYTDCAISTACTAAISTYTAYDGYALVVYFEDKNTTAQKTDPWGVCFGNEKTCVWITPSSAANANYTYSTGTFTGDKPTAYSANVGCSTNNKGGFDNLCFGFGVNAVSGKKGLAWRF